MPPPRPGGIYLYSNGVDSGPVVKNNIVANCIEGQGVVVQGAARPGTDYNALWNNPDGNFNKITLAGRSTMC